MCEVLTTNPNDDDEENDVSAVAIGNFAGYSAPVRRSHLRMTKRGRAVLLTLVASPLVVVALVFGINAGGATATSSSTPLAKVTVVGGETLWSLAKQVAPNADPRDVVADIMSVNRLTSADIQPGEQLAIPAQYGH
jgi:LysM domain